MIVVLLGTNPYSFERLISEVDRLAERKNLDVFVQLGNTPYEPGHCRFERFLEKNELLVKIREAEIVICHGGFGSIRDALALCKPVISVPRLPERGESPDHQLELVQELEKEGRIIAVYDVSTLWDAITAARTFRPSTGNASHIPELIDQFINGRQDCA